MADGTQQQPLGAPTSRPLRRGTFLPSMHWTEDREEVEHEKQRLLALHEQLRQLVDQAAAGDECATWWMMADASLCQLDRDLDDLFEWLEQTERSMPSEDRDRGAPDGIA